MPRPLPYLRETPSQTAGPYVHIGLVPAAAGIDARRPETGHDICGPNAAGARIRIDGRVIDGMGAPVRDAVLEIWQANAAGHHAHPDSTGPVEPGFRGWGRVTTDFDTGAFCIDTIKPGPVPMRDGRAQAPHLSLWIVARGINIGLSTRVYFDDEPRANAEDPVLALIEWEHRRATLIATRAGALDGRVLYRFDIRLQGEAETVFFDV